MLFTDPKIIIGPKPSTQPVPESNDATNAIFTRTNNRQILLVGANRDVMQTVDFLTSLFLDGKKSHVLFKNDSVQNTR